MRTYAIINVNDITEEKLSECKGLRGNPCNMETETLRKSIDETKAVIKWDGDNPAWVAELGLETYTPEGLLLFLNGNEDWEREEV